jgi:hypothetical protein
MGTVVWARGLPVGHGVPVLGSCREV